MLALRVFALMNSDRPAGPRATRRGMASIRRRIRPRGIHVGDRAVRRAAGWSRRSAPYPAHSIPGEALPTRTGDWRRYEIRYDRAGDRVAWWIDGKPVAARTKVGPPAGMDGPIVKLRRPRIGGGLFTLLTISPTITPPPMTIRGFPDPLRRASEAIPKPNHRGTKWPEDRNGLASSEKTWTALTAHQSRLHFLRSTFKRAKNRTDSDCNDTSVPLVVFDQKASQAKAMHL
jgi:hypothetical protein